MGLFFFFFFLEQSFRDSNSIFLFFENKTSFKTVSPVLPLFVRYLSMSFGFDFESIKENDIS